MPPDWVSLARSLPRGRELAKENPGGPWTLPGAQKKTYPYIHSPMVEEKTLALAGGDYERGRALFFGDKLKCSTCHRIREEGGLIGPDLSNLVSHDAASVLRDIKEPNASINPDYVAYNISLRNGELLAGLVRAQDEDALRLVGVDGKETILRRAEVRELRPSTVSLMPSGLLDALNESQIRDLLTFVLSAPSTRTRAEIQTLLS